MEQDPLECTDCGSTDDVRDREGKKLCYVCTFLEKNLDIKHKLIAHKNGKIVH